MCDQPYPLISCICLTRNRPHYLKRAIGCFVAQSYRHKELLVVIRDDDFVSKEIVQAAGRSDISYLAISTVPKKTLGEIRNLAIASCKGEYFCQWDDDDWYHNARLETQLEAIIKHEKSASALAKWIVYNAVSGQAFLSGIGPWAASIMCKKELINDQVKYPALSLREDSMFLSKLYGINCLIPVLAPTIYIYIYHGKNTWHARHFNRLFATSKPLSPYLTQLVKDILDEKIRHEQASALLLEPAVLKEIDYFYFPQPSKRKVLMDLWGGAVYLTRLSVQSFIRYFRLQR